MLLLFIEQLQKIYTCARVHSVSFKNYLFKSGGATFTVSIRRNTLFNGIENY